MSSITGPVRLLALCSMSACLGPPLDGRCETSDCASAQGAASGEAPSWPRFHFDATSAGFNPGETISNQASVAGLAQKWVFNAKGPISTNPVVANGVVYVGTGVGFAGSPAPLGGVWAIGTWEGRLKWRRAMAGPITGTPMVLDGALYVAEGGDSLNPPFGTTLYSLNAADGSVNWQYEAGAPMNTSPNISLDGKYVYVGDDTGAMHAVDRATGAPYWKFEHSACDDTLSGPATSASVDTTSGNVWFGSGGCVAYVAPDMSNPTAHNNTFTVVGLVTSAPSVVPDGDGDGEKAAALVGSYFEATQQTFLYELIDHTYGVHAQWVSVVEGRSVSSAAFTDDLNGIAYVGDGKGKLVTRDRLSGIRCRAAHLGSSDAIASSPALSADLAFIGSPSHSVYAVPAETAATCLQRGDIEPLWSADLGAAVSSSPTVAGGKLYVGTDDGDLYKLGL